MDIKTQLIAFICLMIAISPAYAVQVDENTTIVTFGGAFNYTFSEQMNFTIVAEDGDHITLNYTNFSIYPLTGTGNATIVQVEDTLINFTVCALNEVNMSFENLSTGIDLYVVEDDTTYENIIDNQNITLNAGSCKEINILFLDNDITINTPENITYYNSSVLFNITTNTSSICEFSFDDENYTYMSPYTSCYQETANISTACGGLDTGTYNFSANVLYANNFYDEDWDTYSFWGVGATPSIRYVNYTIPTDAIDSSKLQIKYGLYSGSCNVFENLSLSSCFEGNILQIKEITTMPVMGTYKVDWACWNDTAWETLDTCQCSSSRVGDIYEEAMYWDIKEYSTEHTYTKTGLTRGQHNVTFKCYDGVEYINETVYFSINNIPTAPTDLNLTDPVYVTEVLTANCTGSTDADSDSLTYYYQFYNVNDTTTVQAYSTTDNYTIQSTDVHDNISVSCKAYDGLNYSDEFDASLIISNTNATTPTSLNLTDPVYVTDVLTANCTGSTDADGDSITYYYQFYNVNDTTTVQAYSTSENYTIQSTDARDNITVSCKAYDGINFSASINENISISYNTLNITVLDINNNTIYNFSITLESDDYPYLDTQNTTTGSMLFYLNNNSDYTFTVDAEGYAMENVTITSNETEHNYTFYLYTDNSISFIFEDELTGSIIDYANISIELISDLFASNYSTTNGTLYVDELPIGEYIIRYDADGYSERVYYFTLVNRTHTSLTLYLLNDSSTTEVTATVYDQNNNLLEDVYIKVLKYDLTTNSYLVQEIVKTNFEGETIMHIVLNSEFYKFLLEYDSEIVKETTPSYIYATTLTFQVLIGEAYGEDFYNNNDISHHIIFNNDTNNFRYTYSDPNNLLESSCLKVWRSSVIGDILVDETCVNSSSGTILIGVTNSSGTTYKASAYIYRDGEEVYMSSLWQSFLETILSSKTALFYITILVILMGFLGTWNVPVAVILTPLGLIFGALVGFVNISMMYLIPLEILAVIIAYMISKKS